MTMTAEKSVDAIQRDFNITSLRIDGEDISGFKIAANTDIEAEKLVAEKFRELVYETTGVYLEITKDAIHLIHNKAKSFRQIVNNIDILEKVAQANGFTQIDENIAKEVLCG